MAKKTKKLHPGGLAQNDFMAGVRRQQRGQKQNPGGSVPTLGGRRLSPAEIRLKRRGARRGKKTDREIAQASGFKNMRQMQAALERMTPEQRTAFNKKNETRFRNIFARNTGEFETRNAKLLKRVRRQQRGQKQNPMMPTAGMSQGRPAIGRAPMPGPAPDPERMKRFQKLMREARERGLKAQAPPKAFRPKKLRSMEDIRKESNRIGSLITRMMTERSRGLPKRRRYQNLEQTKKIPSMKANRKQLPSSRNINKLPDARYS